jgi:hypothetical protein
LTVGLSVIFLLDIGGLRMRKPQPSLFTKTEEFTPPELPLRQPLDRPIPPPFREQGATDRIREALLRWLEEEL